MKPAKNGSAAPPKAASARRTRRKVAPVILLPTPRNLTMRAINDLKAIVAENGGPERYEEYRARYWAARRTLDRFHGWATDAATGRPWGQTELTAAEDMIFELRPICPVIDLVTYRATRTREARR